MRQVLALAMAFSTACGSDADGTDPVECAPEGADRRGTYLLSYDERPDGTCGAIADVLVSDIQSATLEESCEVQAERWTDCRFETSFRCVDPDAGDILNATAFTDQVTSDGSIIEGIVTWDIRYPDGSPACVSTYDVRYVRQ